MKRLFFLFPLKENALEPGGAIALKLQTIFKLIFQTQSLSTVEISFILSIWSTAIEWQRQTIDFLRSLSFPGAIRAGVNQAAKQSFAHSNAAGLIKSRGCECDTPSATGRISSSLSRARTLWLLKRCFSWYNAQPLGAMQPLHFGVYSSIKTVYHWEIFWQM